MGVLGCLPGQQGQLLLLWQHVMCNVINVMSTVCVLFLNGEHDDDGDDDV